MKEYKDGHMGVWREEKKGANDVIIIIIISKKKYFKQLNVYLKNDASEDP